MGEKTLLKNVAPWSIIKLADGRLGVAPNKPMRRGYSVSLDGDNQRGIVLKGDTEVTVVKQAARISLDALAEMLQAEEAEQTWDDTLGLPMATVESYEAADRKCKCGDPMTFGQAQEFGQCPGCVVLRAVSPTEFIWSDAPLLWVRFKANADDPRPVHWPVKHPYWITGEAADGSYAIIVSYADDEEYILRNWPDAKGLDVRECFGYQFTDRFPKPEGFVLPEGFTVPA